jgi:hypothetical protein
MDDRTGQMIDLPLPKSTRAVFSVAVIGDDDEHKAAEVAKASSSLVVATTLVIVVLAAAILPFDCAVQAFEFFVFIAKKAAGIVETFWRFPSLCATTGVALIGGRSGTPAPLTKVLSDLARRMFWWATGPDDDDDNDSGASGGGDNTSFSSDVNETRSRVVLVVGMIPVVCKLTLRVLHRAGADRGFVITTASMKTLLRLRLCCGGCGVGDGLRLHGRRSERGGSVANAVRVAACCGCCAAELGVTGDKRLFRTSSRSASLSSSVLAPRSPRLFFLGGECGESVGTLLARLLPILGVLGEEAAIAMRSSRDGRAAGFGGEFSLSEEHGPPEVFFGERSGDRGNRDGETEGDVVPMTKL